MPSLPILKNHDPSQVIGKISTEDSHLIVEMLPGHELSKEEMHWTFGGAACLVLEWHGDINHQRIKKFRVPEFSLDDLPVEPGRPELPGVMEQREKDLNAAASMFILLTRLMNRAKVSEDRTRDRDYWDCRSIVARVQKEAPDIAALATAWMEADPNGLNKYEPTPKG